MEKGVEPETTEEITTETCPFIDNALVILNYIKLNPVSSVKLYQSLVPCVLFSFFGLEVLADVVFNWKGFDSVDDVCVVVGTCQIIPKMFILIVNRERIAKLISEMKTYLWPLDKYGDDVRTEVLDLYKKIGKCLKLMNVAVIISFITFLFKPLILKERDLPFPSYHPKDLSKSPNYEIAYVINTSLAAIAAPSVLGFDYLFTGFAIHIINEIQMIKRGFLNIPFENENHNCSRDVAEMVDHHNFLMNCIQEINSIYSVPLLLQFLTSTFCICMSFFSVIISGFPPDMHRVMIAVPYMLTFMGLLFIYCIVGTVLTTETESVADVIFGCGWWLSADNKMKKLLILPINRAQKSEVITAGGLIPLNLNTFTSILKSALSYATIGQALTQTE